MTGKYVTFSRIAFFFMLLTLLLFSCRKHDHVVFPSGNLSLSKTSVRLDTTAGTQDTFTVHSSVVWIAKLSSPAVWLRIDSTAGSAGNSIVRLTVLPNTNLPTPQTVTVTFSPNTNSDIPPVSITIRLEPYSFELAHRIRLGGSNFDGVANSTALLQDGSMALVGTTTSSDGDIHGSHGASDLLIVKLNSAGDTAWTKVYGGSNDDIGSAIIATADGGYAVAGSTKSNNGNVLRNYGGEDIWLLKLDAAGNIQWSKTYGGSGNDRNSRIVATGDGGYAVSASVESNNGDIHNPHGGADMWLAKLDGLGNIIWSQNYGGSGLDEPRSMTISPDGGFILAGLTNSNDGDVSGYHTPNFFGFDMWVIKVDARGNKLWAHVYGGKGDDVALSVIATPEGYVVAGYTNSNDGDVTGYHGTNGFFYDMWILKLDEDGNKKWTKTLGGTRDDYALGIIRTADGGYVVVGSTASKNGDISGYHDNGTGLDDICIAKLNGLGNKLWGKAIGGTGDDYAFSVTPYNDGYIIAGIAESIDGDMLQPAPHGDYDIWVAKIVVQ